MVEGTGQTVAICFLTVALVMLMDIIKTVRRNLVNDATFGANYLKVLTDSKHLLSSVLLGLQMFITYSLMLIAMLYNTWVIIALCFGFTLSHWLITGARLSDMP